MAPLSALRITRQCSDVILQQNSQCTPTRQFSSTIGCIVGRIDRYPIATIEIIMFITEISYELNDVDLMTMIIDICHRIQHN